MRQYIKQLAATFHGYLLLGMQWVSRGQLEIFYWKCLSPDTGVEVDKSWVADGKTKQVKKH